MEIDTNRALSWSQISSFEYSPEQWYQKYVLGIESKDSPEMIFGKTVAESFETDSPLAPVIRYSSMEHELKGNFGGIPVIGYMDTYEPGGFKMREYKTGKKSWDQKRADSHGQIDMYLLMLYMGEKIRPEEMMCHIDWMPTQQNGDFTISFIEPLVIHTFETRRTMKDILTFGSRILQTRKMMEEYAKNHP